MDELANINALYTESRAELEQSKADGEELEELRELKSDVERKEKQQAMIIENQVSRSELACWYVVEDDCKGTCTCVSLCGWVAG